VDVMELRRGAGLAVRAFVDRVSSGDDQLDGSDGVGDEHDRATPPGEMLFPLPFLRSRTTRFCGERPARPHVKVATYRQVVREPYLRPVGDGLSRGARTAKP